MKKTEKTYFGFMSCVYTGGNSVAVRVNSRVDLDPAFGNIHPGECDAFWVMVTPKEPVTGHKLNDYYFIMLVPETEAEGTDELISDCMQEALEPGDQYTTKAIKHEDLETFDPATPILSFDPDRLENTGDIDLIWLRPPRWYMQ
jgi:hypothetical protein